MVANKNNNNNGHGLRLAAYLLCFLLILWLVPNLACADYPLSSLRGKLLINEVLIKQSGGSTIAENDEFIELYNAGTSAINLSQLSLIDGNLFTGELDGTIGSITGNTNPFRFSCTGLQICEGSTVLPPQAYAVIWIGQKGTPTQAPQASFQAWLRGAPKLNDAGDDLWLYEQTASGWALVDYIAVGAGSAVNNNPPTSIWNAAYNAKLNNTVKGQSVSLSPNGQLSSAACWEATTSGQASSTCSGYLPTLSTDTLGHLQSVGRANTVLNANASSGFILSKSVWNVTRNIAGDVAKPNEILRYTLQYTNHSKVSLTALAVHDTVPEFTHLVGTPQCVSTPLGLGGCQVLVSGVALAWQFTGSLLAGEGGFVEFEVQVD